MGKTAVLAIKIVGDARDGAKALDDTAAKSSRLAGVAKKAGAVAAAGFAAIGVGAVKAVSAAGDLQQSYGAVDTVFGKSAGKMHTWASSAATDVGLTANEFNNLGTLIGTQLKNGGTAMDKLAPKTRNLITTGSDLASMYGGTTADAVEALSSALKGERDPIERYGVSLTQAKIDAEAASLGFKKVGGSLSTEATQAATLALITKQTADAHGNFARETDTLQHQQQVFKASLANTSAELGTVLLPVATKAFGWLNDHAVPAIDKTVKAIQMLQGGASGADIAAKLGLSATTGAKIDKVAGALQSLKTWVDGLDFSNLSDSGPAMSSLADSGAKIGPAIQDAAASTKDLAPSVGSLLSSGIQLLPGILNGAATAAKFLADHQTLLAGALVAGGVAYAGYKTFQAAKQVADIAEVALLPARIAATFALAASNRALAAAQVQTSIATTESNVAGTASIFTRTRQAVVTIASTVAERTAALASRTWAAAQWILNAALSANPIGLVVLAIVALVAIVVLIATKTTWFQTIWSAVWTAIKATTAAIVTGIKATLNWFAGLPGLMAGWWNAAKAAVVNALNKAAAFVRALPGRIFAGLAALGSLGAKFLTWFGRAYLSVLKKVGQIYLYVALIPARIIAKIASLGAKLFSAFGTHFARAKTAANNKVTELIAYVKSIPAKILAALGNLGNLLRDAGRKLIGGLIGGITSKISGVKNVLGGITSKLTSWKGPPAKDARILTPAGKLIIDGLIAGIRAQTPALRKELGRITDTVQDDLTASPKLTLTPDNTRVISNRSTGTAARPAVQITIQGALDPLAVARQIRQLLTDYDVLVGA